MLDKDLAEIYGYEVKNLNRQVKNNAARNKIQTMPGGGTATVKIELPANWNELMKAAGYKPLAEFHLTSDLKPSQPRESGQDRGTQNRQQYRRQQGGDRQNGSYNRQNRGGQNGMATYSTGRRPSGRGMSRNR